LSAKRVARDFQPLPTVILALLVLAFSAVIGLWWWSGTEGSLEWTLRRIARSQPLTAEGVTGSLRENLYVRRLVWERDGLKIEANNVQVAWQPLALLEGTVKLEQVHASALRITDRRPGSAEPRRLPESLAIRPPLQLDDVAIGRVEYIAAQTFRADALAGRYWFDGESHWFRVNGVRLYGGSYRGAASLGARAPLPLDASLSGRLDAPVPGVPAKLPLQFTVTVRGPLADLQAQALLHAPMGPTGTQPTHATATARITPWGAQPVPHAQVQLNAFDLSALWPQAPQTLLAGRVWVLPAGTGAWQVSAQLRNDSHGPWDQQRLPIEHLTGQGEWRAGTALVQELDARVGAGQVHASGEWRAGSQNWTLQGEVKGVEPGGLHTQMAAVPLSGLVEVRHDAGAIAFQVALNASEPPGAKPIPRRRGAQPTLEGTVRALELRQVLARGRWADGRLSLPKLQLRARDASLQGELEIEPQAGAGKGRLDLRAPGLRAQVKGELERSRGAGTLHVDGGDLAAAQRWLRRVPGMPTAIRSTGIDGRAILELAWRGGWADPVMQGGLSVPALQVRTSTDSKSAPAWSVNNASASLDGRLSDASLVAHARARQGQRQLGLDLAARGGRAPLRPGTPANWRAQVTRLSVSAVDPAISMGTWQLASQRAFDLRWSPASGRLDVSAGQAVLAAPAVKAGTAPSQAVLSWDPVRWGGGELRTVGRFTGLPMGWIELLGGPQLAGSALSGDMVFDANWDASLGRVVKLNASLVRSRGDITVLVEGLQGPSSRVPAGVRDARLALASQGEHVTVTLRWDSERAGVADGRLATRLAPGGAAGWQWPDNAPIEGYLRAQLPRIGVWSLLAPPGWRLRGSLIADVRAGGTRGDPRLAGMLAADDLALRSVADGFELRNGRLRATFQENRLVVGEFTLQGAGESGGTLSAGGEAAWVGGEPRVRATARLDGLRASIRSDFQLTMSGNLAARLDAAGAEISGRLKVDQARIVLPEENEPKLGDDVVVRNAPAGALPQKRPPEPAAETSARPLVLAVDLDLGDDFRVRGRGLQTRLRGTLALSGRSIAAPRLVGTITTAGGEYRAYNQRLDVERGVLRFTGRIDNPALDILAIRPNIVQRVGVLITGNAQAPFVRLYAEPDLPDAEKLAWLVTGRPAPSGGAEAALVQQAALALLSRQRGGSGPGVAGAVGLDELSVRRDSSEGPVVTLGKRFGRNFYASYERSLSGALGTLYVFYDVSRRLTVRAEAGERSGLDLIFTFAFD
jgi:translocation and assembly module TamB